MRSASVGERRAARIAGRSPAIAPIAIAAAIPPAQAFGGDHDRPALRGGVDDRGGRADADADYSAREREQDRFGEELAADLVLGRAERASEPDLRAAFEHGDDHDVRDADGADE
jgi:hypothetical protein